jgi:dihydroxyacetone kinase phosphotransfer subunit
VTVGLVVVSHSRPLARAAVALAREMLHDNQIRFEIAAGLDDTTFGTDAAAIVDAVGAADDGDGVVVLMDLGSAVLSAELALELLDDDARQRTVLCPAALVEGLIVAAVAAAGGASTATVAAEASNALAGKVAQLVPATAAPIDETGDVGEFTGSFVITNPHGLHIRPAARLVQEVRRRGAQVWIRNRRTGSEWVDAGVLSDLTTLDVRCGDELHLRVSGEHAAESLADILLLADHQFEDAPAP